ncbi:gustatory receptor 68a-like [Cotesia glomerata]|uniref:gustatory receptor 68a-like n=1 Tax=Cotesia glomerata TaxID=32391 RepID=UPI001D021723|nr:gustatory receptor 68a-like [Cotesia glomerata]
MVHFFLCFVLFVCELFVRKIYAEVLWFAPFIISSWVLMQYTLLLIIISQLFESINATILKFRDLNRYQTINSKVLRQEFDVKDIYCINNAIMQLCDVCNQIADFYAIPTLLIIVYFITTTTYSIYYVILSVFLLKESDFMILSTVIGIWTFITVVDMVIVTLNVTRITRGFSKTPHHICSLLHRYSMNFSIREALLDLLRDISHRDVKFTTYGVITLDGSLLQTIFGTMVTYLIILVQFHD